MTNIDIKIETPTAPLMEKCGNLSSFTTQFGDVGKTHPTTRSYGKDAPASSTQLPNGIRTEDRPIIALDWSRTEITVFEKGKKIRTFSSLKEAAPNYTGYIWVLESTADSFELQNRQKDLDAIAENNITAYCFHPKHTARYRVKFNIKKTDSADAKVIYRIFTETKLSCFHFKQLIDKSKEVLRNQCQSVLIKDRWAYDNEQSLAVAKEYLSDASVIPKIFYDYLFDYSGLKLKTPKYRPRKSVGKFIMVAKLVKESGRGFREFRRQIGNYGQGFGCMARSEFYHHVMTTVLNSRLKELGIEKKFRNMGVDPKTKEPIESRVFSTKELRIKKQVMKELSAALKFLWHLV